MNKNYRGPAESKELSEDGPAIDQADKGSAKKGHHKKGGAKHHGNMSKKKGAAEYGGKKGDDSKSKKDYEGGAKYKKGAGDYDVKKGSHDHPHSGPGRMGYTQNFGPARQNGYARGAAKVAKIMGYPGAGDHIEGHLKEVSVSAPDNSGSEQRSDVVSEGLSIKEQRLANQKAGLKLIQNQKTRDSSLVDMSNPNKAKQMFNFTISPNTSRVNEGGIIEYVSPKSRGSNYERVYGSTHESNIRRNFPENNYSGEYYNAEQADQIIKYQKKIQKNANQLNSSEEN